MTIASATAKSGTDMGTLILLSKKATSVWLNLSEYALLVFALIVVMGLIGEHKRAWPHPRYELFAILVAIGCAGEMIADGGVFFFSRHLQAISDSELRDATIKSGKAQDSADKAADAADRANASAQQAKNRAEEIGKQADELRRKTSELSTKLTAAEIAELEEREKVLDMEAWLSPRVLPLDFIPNLPEERQYWASLKPFAGTNAIITPIIDEESRRAAGNIAAFVREAGWNFNVQSPDLSMSIGDGVTVWYHLALKPSAEEDKRSRETAESLVDLLTEYGWEAYTGTGARSNTSPLWVPPNSVRINVGLKPNPYISPKLPRLTQERTMEIKRIGRQLREYEQKVRNWEKGGSKGPRPALPNLVVSPDSKFQTK